MYPESQNVEPAQTNLVSPVSVVRSTSNAVSLGSDEQAETT